MATSFRQAELNEKSSLAFWTVNDQRKLLSFKGFHQRFLEYHNNIHVKLPELSKLRDESSDSNTVTSHHDAAAIVATAFCCCAEAVSDRPTTFSKAQLATYVQQYESVDGFIWFHLTDLSCLNIISQKFPIHELCLEEFEDLRAHSLLTPTPTGTLLALCIHQLESHDIAMYKLFIYAARGVVITYQCEILPDVDNPIVSAGDSVVDNTLRKYRKHILREYRMGPMYLMYRLALEALLIQDPCLEYFSTTLSYFDKVVHLNLLHREKLDIMIKIHIVSSAVAIMQRCVEEVQSIFNCFVSVALSSPSSDAASGAMPSDAGSGKQGIAGNAYGLRRLFGSYLVSEEHSPFLIDLHDAYAFMHACLSNVYNETCRLDTELDATIQLRSGNTTIVLSLIATTFLPMTFLAGVFGMNFEKDGGYTIGLLNEGYGPLTFYMMCALCFLVTSTFFISQGWIEVPFLRYLNKKINPEKFDDSKKHSEGAVHRAEAEEHRRREATYRRRSYSTGSNRRLQSFFQTGSMLHSPMHDAGGAGSSTNVPFSVHAPSTPEGSMRKKNPQSMDTDAQRSSDGVPVVGRTSASSHYRSSYTYGDRMSRASSNDESQRLSVTSGGGTFASLASIPERGNSTSTDM